jgi:hypothetical protein
MYIYVRTNPIIDDSWIGTLVNIINRNSLSTSFTEVASSKYVVPVSPVTTYLGKYSNNNYLNDTSFNSASQKDNSTSYVTVAAYAPFQNDLLETISAIWDKILTHDIAIYTLSGRINTLSNSINNTNNINTTNNSNTTNTINTFSGRVTTAEANISSLSGALAATNTRLSYAG